MKKVLTILLVILLSFAVGCTAQEEVQIPPAEADSSTEVNNTATSSVEVDAEIPMPTFSSVEELITAVQTERQAKNKSSLARNGDLETLSVTYAPANEIDGFHLCMIEVCPDKVFYMYEHEGKEMPYFEWTKGIIFTVYRDPSYTLESFCDQYDMIPDEEGFAYDSKMGEVYFIKEDTVISVLVPEHMNDYNTIRSLCEMEKIEILDDNEITENELVIASWEIDAEEKMPLFSSVETLAQSSYFESLTTIYTPPAEMEGFCLRNIELLPHGMIYYYDPGEVPLDHFGWSQGITYTIHQNSMITMESICAQNELLPDEDGYAYDAEGCEMYFEQDGIAASVHVPEHMNDYDTLRSLCRLETVTVP